MIGTRHARPLGVRTSITALLPIVLLAGCPSDLNHAPGSGAVTPPPASPSKPLVAKLEGIAQRMHDRFGAARRLEEALARSDLERATLEARSIGALEEPDVLPEWKPYFTAVAEAAANIATATDVIAAAKHAGLLGLRCAGCHTAIAARVVIAPDPRPAEDPKRGPTMAGHQWAAVQLWTGLIAPANDRWLAGAEALTSVPLTMVAQATTSSSQLDVDDVARVRLLARRALNEPSQVGRAEIFGSLLAACAHCHAVLRDR